MFALSTITVGPLQVVGICVYFTLPIDDISWNSEMLNNSWDRKCSRMTKCVCIIDDAVFTLVLGLTELPLSLSSPLERHS